MQELASSMTAEEFGLHLALDQHQPLAPGVEHATAALVASVANGPLTRKDKRMWAAADFIPKAWADDDEDATSAPPPMTIEQIRAAAMAAGMGN